MNREMIVRSTSCKPCTAVGKNLKSVNLASNSTPIPCTEPNQDIQIGFCEPNYDEKSDEIDFLASIDRFSKLPASCIFEKATELNKLKILEMYIETHGTPRAIRLDPVKYPAGHQLKTRDFP